MGIVAFGLALGCAWFLVRPHLASVSAPSSIPSLEREHLIEQKGRFVQMLKDLELDLQMKRITQDDYEQMKLSLSLELAQVIEALEPESKTLAGH